jgi:hypothetical protein
VFANSREEYWWELNNRLWPEYQNLTNMIHYLEEWDEKSKTWKTVFEYSDKNQIKAIELFR